MISRPLLAYIKRVKDALPNIPVGYVDAYYEFSVHPSGKYGCNFSNCYPYWEGCDIDGSLAHMQAMFGQASHAANRKKVIITETGWPSQGSGLKGLSPEKMNISLILKLGLKWQILMYLYFSL
jgi:exo-beta-1,3-glucanase (GH17 family)